jgi:hypothetical protein
VRGPGRDVGFVDLGWVVTSGDAEQFSKELAVAVDRLGVRVPGEEALYQLVGIVVGRP